MAVNFIDGGNWRNTQRNYAIIFNKSTFHIKNEIFNLFLGLLMIV